MKKFRLVATMFVAVVLFTGFVSCSDDDEKHDANLIGKWSIGKVDDRGKSITREEWIDEGGYPYFVINATHCYFTDDEGIDKSDYSTYIYDADKKVLNAEYVSRDYSFVYEVLKLTNNELNIKWDENGNGKRMMTIYCSRID